MLRANVFKIPSNNSSFLLLPTILLCGFILRTLGINAGLPNHPDPRESLIAQDILNLISFSAIPEIFNWPGTAWFYLIAFVGKLVSILGIDVTESHVILIARFINVMLSTGTIWLIYSIGKRIFNEPVGFISAGFLAVSMLHATNESRLALVDIPATFCVTLFLWLLSRDMQFNLRTCFWLGIVAGIGFAVKFSTVFVGFSLLIFFATERPLRKLSIIVGVAMITFTIVCPYWLIDLFSPDWNGFFDDFWYETAHYHRGHFGLFASEETGWLNRFLYLWTLLKWGMGLPLALLIGISILFILIISLISIRKAENRFRLLDRKTRYSSSLLVFVITYLLFIGTFKVSFTRHLLLIYPVLTMLCSIFLISVDKLSGFISGSVVWLYSFIYTAAFVSVLLSQPTAQETIDWVSANIPHEDTISRSPEVLFDWLLPELDRDYDNSDEITDWVITVQPNWEVFEKYRQNPTAYRKQDWFPLEKIEIEKTLHFYERILGKDNRYKLHKTFKRSPQFFDIQIDVKDAPFPMKALIHPEIHLYRHFQE